MNHPCFKDDFATWKSFQSGWTRPYRELILLRSCIFLDLIPGTRGIYPDLLHIVDLQISHDVISSCLVEMSGSGGPRDQQLSELWCNYEHWCRTQRPMAHKNWCLFDCMGANSILKMQVSVVPGEVFFEDPKK